MEDLIDVLQKLSLSGDNQDDSADAPCVVNEADVAVVRNWCAWLQSQDEDECRKHWQSAVDAGVSFVSVANALANQLRSKEPHEAAHAAMVYAALLRAKHGPVSSLFTALAFSNFLQVCKQCITPSNEPAKKRAAAGAGKKGGKPRKKQASAMSDDSSDGGHASDGDDEVGPSRRATQATQGGAKTADVGLSLLTELSGFLTEHGLAQQEEILAMVLDTCMEVVAVMPPARMVGRAVGGRSHAGTPGAADLSYRVLDTLMDSRHGTVTHTFTLVLMRLLPTLLGTGAPAGRKEGAAETNGRRSAALQFVLGSYRRFPDTLASVCALIRQLCMRALDKAELRGAAVSAANELVSSLPRAAQIQICSWLLILSHSQRPVQRLVAVDMAQALLNGLSQPFAPEAGYKAFMDGTRGPGEEVEAPWSAVMLALLLQRCDDKAAAVRARAMSHLSDAVTHFSLLLGRQSARQEDDDGEGPTLPIQAEGFLLALCGAGLLTLQDADPGAAAAGGRKLLAAAPAGKKPANAKDKKGVVGGRGRKGGRRAVQSDDSAGDESVDEDAGEGTTTGAAAVRGGDQATAQLPLGPGKVAVLPSRVRLDLQPVMALAHRRLQDDKAPVRKAALALLEAALMLRAGLPAPAGGPPQNDDMVAVEAATADSLVSVRKAALTCVGRLVTEFPSDVACCELWVRAALPLVRDAETSIQEALAEQVITVLMQPLQSAASTSAHTASGAVNRVAPLLGVLGLAGRSALACVGKACAALTAKKAVQGKRVAAGLEAVILALKGGVETDAATGGAATVRAQLQGAWAVLREISACDSSAASWQFLTSEWSAVRAAAGSAGKRGAAGTGTQITAASSEGDGTTAAALLWVISHSAERFPAQDAQQLSKDLSKALLAFNLPPAAAAAHIAALARLSGHGGEDGAGGAKAAWSAKLLEGAHEVLTKFMDKQNQRDEAAVWRASAALFAVGEVALLGVKPSPALVIRVQSLTAASVQAPTAGMSQLPRGFSQGTQGMVDDWTDGLRAGGDLNTQDGAAWAAGVDGMSQGGAEGVVVGAGGLTAGSLGGLAWACLGKLCLTDESLAKRAVPLFVQELNRSSSPVVRNNCLVALADMCIHFTAMVDSYLPRLAGLIRDPHELVRRQALALLANLLMKDYVKWRGALFHRFSLALVDPSPHVRALAEHLLGETLATKAPLLAYNHFIESLFVLNACTAGLHAARLGGGGAGGGAGAGGGGGEALAAARDACGLFNLKGDSHEMRCKRDAVYHTLLRKMSQENKFSTQAKLVSEVLGAVADGVLPLNDAGVAEVLGDALRLLGSKHIKVNTARVVATEEDTLLAAAGSEGAGATQVVAEAAHAKGKLVSSMMKKHLVEHVVPLLCELKHMLQGLRHPLLSTLMCCMASMLKDYKSELEDILVVDKQLAKEILYDLKQAELAAKHQHNHPQHHTQQQPAAAPVPVGGRTPLAAEVLLASAGRPVRTVGRGGTARSSGADTGRRDAPTTPAPGRTGPAVAVGGATPGAALLANARTPRSLVAGGRTPRTVGGRVAGAGVGLTPAPVSTRRVTGGNQGGMSKGGPEEGEGEEEDEEEGGAGGGRVCVTLPAVEAREEARVWNVQLEEGQRKEKGKKRGGGKGAGEKAVVEETGKGGGTSVAVSGKAAAGRGKGKAGSDSQGKVVEDGGENVQPVDAGGSKGRGKRGREGEVKATRPGPLQRVNK